MPKVDLVREADGYRQKMSIDIFDWSGSSVVPAGWKVRVSAYDGKSPMPSISELLAGGSSAKATEPLYAKTVAKYRADGWADELAPEALARIQRRVAREEAAEDARADSLAQRLAAFPASEKDRTLAAALAEPAGVRELDLRGDGGDGGDRVTVVPPGVKKLVELEVLRLDGNALPEIPEQLGACKQLRELYLADNALEDVPFPVRSGKQLAVLDLRNNRIRSTYVRPKVPMRLELAGNPLEPAVQDLLTRSAIGDFRKLAHVGVDTDCLFPIDLSYFAVDYPNVKALPTASVVLYGRPPTDAELATLARLLPKAKIEHRLAADTAPANEPRKQKQKQKLKSSARTRAR